MIYILPLLCCLSDDSMFDLVKNTKVAALSTIYKNEIPFTSLVPYALDKQGRPLVFISDIAVHTKNLKNKSSCSLMVSKINEKDFFESVRLTYIGKMVRVHKREIAEVQKIYLDKFPDAEYLMELEDFAFYRLEVSEIYYIGGFASAEWIDLKDYQKHWKK